MKRSIALIFTLCCLQLSYTVHGQSCTDSTRSFTKALKMLPDSIKSGSIVIHYLFKSQILAHENGQYDTTIIIKKVYAPHRLLWDSCYAMIFGDANANKFNNPHGMVSWNKTLYKDNKQLFDNRVRQLIDLQIDKKLNTNLKRLNKLVPYQPKATISILFSPFEGLGFGGCNAQQFALELNSNIHDLNYVIEKGIPHELNHIIYEPFRSKDTLAQTALGQTIDEGFACYFTWVFFDRKIPQYEAVEDMSVSDWDWYLAHEKELFIKLKPYFYDKSGNKPIIEKR